MLDTTERNATKVFCHIAKALYEHCLMLIALCTGVRDCSAHGSCIKPDVCSCNPGYTGADCRRKAVCLHGCSGSGICLGNEKCLCNVDWTGSKCDVRSCESLQFCSGKCSWKIKKYWLRNSFLVKVMASA